MPSLRYYTNFLGDGKPMIHEMTDWIMMLMQTHGPAMVVIGVLIESVIVPIPSPLIIMGAGFLLIEPGLSMVAAFWPIMLKIVIPGALASTVGALFAYGIAYWGGKPLIDKFQRFLGFDWDDILFMERKIDGRVGLMLFLLRALPIVPLSLISAAAGVLRLKTLPFILWTLAGSFPRCLVLAYLGYLTRDTYKSLAGKLNSLESLISGAIVLGSFAIIFWLRHRLSKKTVK